MNSENKDIVEFSLRTLVRFVELEGLEEGPSGSKSALNFTPDSGKLNLGGQSLYDIINEIAHLHDAGQQGGRYQGGKKTP